MLGLPAILLSLGCFKRTINDLKGLLDRNEKKKEDLIKSTENHELLSGDLFTRVGIVGLKSWNPLSKLIGKEESEWVKNEFEEENPSSIVLLYCEDIYVYAFSNPSY
jgi:hypothetical protein